MAMYSVSVTPLIASLQDSRVKQVWFADDATAGGTLHGLRDWWSRLQDLGSFYGYYPNALKTWLIVKPIYFSDAQRLFEGTGVQVTVEGKRHLGAALGSRLFTEQYVSEGSATSLNRVRDFEIPRFHRISRFREISNFSRF